MVVEMGLARPQRQLVGRIAQVVHDQLELGEAGVEQRLKVPVILHPLGQRVADQDDPVPFVKFELAAVSAAKTERRGQRARTAAAARNGLRIAISLASSSL